MFDYQLEEQYVNNNMQKPGNVSFEENIKILLQTNQLDKEYLEFAVSPNASLNVDSMFNSNDLFDSKQRYANATSINPVEFGNSGIWHLGPFPNEQLMDDMQQCFNDSFEENMKILKNTPHLDEEYLKFLESQADLNVDLMLNKNELPDSRKGYANITRINPKNYSNSGIRHFGHGISVESNIPSINKATSSREAIAGEYSNSEQNNAVVYQNYNQERSLRCIEINPKLSNSEKPMNIGGQLGLRSDNSDSRLPIYGEQKLYECELCKETFFHKNELVIHVRRHTGEKKCQHCGRFFSSQTSLRNHQKNIPCELVTKLKRKFF